MTTAAAPPCVVPAWVEQSIRLDERRRIAGLLAANDTDGRLVDAQFALDDLRRRRGFAWLVGALTSIVESPTAPDIEPHETAIDRWLVQAQAVAS